MNFKNKLKNFKRKYRSSESVYSARKGPATASDRGTQRQDMFTRRAFIVASAQGGIMSLLALRMGWLQIAQSEKYTTLAEENRINMLMLAPQRGTIVDRYGIPLAVNIRDFRAVIIPDKTEDMRTALKKLTEILPVSDEKIDDIIKQSRRNSRFLPLEIANNLSWEEISAIEVNRPFLPGIFVEVGDTRHYPLQASTAHLIGYVGRVSEKEITGDPVELLPGYKIGKTGLERFYNEELKGVPGQREVEVNAVGREVRDLTVVGAKPGEQMTLSIDVEYQRFVQNVLSRHKSASAVVMDAHTGAVYALASHPAFDPNLFVNGIPHSIWSELLNDPTFPLTNKAVSGQYPPGSTFKMITALAGLETGDIKKSTRVNCPGHFNLGNAKFHCWKPEGHGSVDVTQALAQSCDVFFYKLSTQIGIDKIVEVSKRFGLGDKLGFELAEEQNGHIPTQAWKRRRFGEGWQAGETVISSIGQGYMLTTPLQLATMTARLVNGGYAVNPWMTGYINNAKMFTQDFPKMDVNDSDLAIIKAGMDDVVNGPKGTARGSAINLDGMEMGGKTGTAQVKRITKEERAMANRRQEDLPWRLRHHALFVGYAPVDNPRYVCSVVVEHGIGGSSAAAPVAKELLAEIQKRQPDKIPLLPNGGMAFTPPTPEKRKG